MPPQTYVGTLVVVQASGSRARPGRAFPMTYFVPISVGAFTKGLGIGDLWTDLVALAVFVPVLALLSVLMLRKQES